MPNPLIRLLIIPLPSCSSLLPLPSLSSPALLSFPSLLPSYSSPDLLSLPSLPHPSPPSLLPLPSYSSPDLLYPSPLIPSLPPPSLRLTSPLTPSLILLLSLEKMNFTLFPAPPTSNFDICSVAIFYICREWKEFEPGTAKASEDVIRPRLFLILAKHTVILLNS